MQGLNTNFAIANKWICYCPISNVLGNAYSNLELNLKRFTIPQLIVGATSVQFKGYTYEIPTKVIDADTKEITLEYLIDSNWANYKALYTFASQTGTFNPVSDETASGVSTSNFIDIRIWLVDPYKKRIIDFIFHNCWIKVFGDLALDYSSADEINHTVTFAYSNFEIAQAAV